MGRKKEDWEQAAYFLDKLTVIEEKDKETNYINNKKFINDKLSQLKMAQKKKLEKETATRERKYNEEKIELQRNYETVLKNSKNMQQKVK